MDLDGGGWEDQLEDECDLEKGGGECGGPEQRMQGLVSRSVRRVEWARGCEVGREGVAHSHMVQSLREQHTAGRALHSRAGTASSDSLSLTLKKFYRDPAMENTWVSPKTSVILEAEF